MTYFYSATVMHADGTKTYLSTTVWVGEDTFASRPEKVPDLDTLAKHVAKAIKCKQSDVVITSLSQAPHFKPEYRLD